MEGNTYEKRMRVLCMINLRGIGNDIWELPTDT